MKRMPAKRYSSNELESVLCRRDKMFIIHGNIKTMEGRDFGDGYVEIQDEGLPQNGRTGS